jgi:hypothetical protein
MKLMPYGEARRHGFTLWEGPGMVDLGEDDNRFFYGDQVLHLAVHGYGPTRLESRSLYAIVSPDEADAQEIAILRAIYWESQGPTERMILGGQPSDPIFQIVSSPTRECMMNVPARFVEVPIAHARTWIETFNNLPFVFHNATADSYGLPRRYLKANWDNHLKIDWQTRHPDYTGLNTLWDYIWQDMGDALERNPIVINVEEYFEDQFRPDTSLYDFSHFPGHESSILRHSHWDG